jgi:hypothetical protein
MFDSGNTLTASKTDVALENTITDAKLNLSLLLQVVLCEFSGIPKFSCA